MSKDKKTSHLDDGSVLRVATQEKWGTIFTSSGEKTIEPVTQETIPAVESKDFDEKDYFDKIRAKATALATQILAEARADAEAVVAEAQQKAQDLRQTIHEEARTLGFEEGYTKGYEEGSAKGHEEAYQSSLDESKEELEALRTNMADSVSVVIHAINEQTSAIFNRWREDILAVCRLAVEKITAVQLHEERAASLKTLINEAVATLHKDRRLVITVNPEDEAVIADILDSTKTRYPDIAVWEVRPNPEITPGGLVIESEFSLAESLVESRKAAVNSIFAHLTLPE